MYVYTVSFVMVGRCWAAHEQLEGATQAGMHSILLESISAAGVPIQHFCTLVYYIRDSHSNFVVPSVHTDGNFKCPEDILCAHVKTETWIIRKVFKISAQHEHHSLTFLKSFPMIPNTWQFVQYEDDFL